MATITIGSGTYDSFSDVAFADTYLGADVARAASWAARSTDDKGRGLVTSTRVLSRLNWIDGVPDFTAPPVAVKEATAVFAADILTKPALASTPGTEQTKKRVKAGSAEVEFFKQDPGTVLPVPKYVFDILMAAGLIGGTADAGFIAPYVSGSDFPSRFTYDDPVVC